jgi:hypothetical protein
LQPRCHLQPEQLREVAAAVAETTRRASTAGHELQRDPPRELRGINRLRRADAVASTIIAGAVTARSQRASAI